MSGEHANEFRLLSIAGARLHVHCSNAWCADGRSSSPHLLLQAHVTTVSCGRLSLEVGCSHVVLIDGQVLRGCLEDESIGMQCYRHHPAKNYAYSAWQAPVPPAAERLILCIPCMLTTLIRMRRHSCTSHMLNVILAAPASLGFPSGTPAHPRRRWRLSCPLSMSRRRVAAPASWLAVDHRHAALPPRRHSARATPPLLHHQEGNHQPGVISSCSYRLWSASPATGLLSHVHHSG